MSTIQRVKSKKDESSFVEVFWFLSTLEEGTSSGHSLLLIS